MDSLIVYLNDVPVGRLTDDGGTMSFTYDRAYAADGRNEPLSHSIPLSEKQFGHEVMEPFLSGLLPEDIIRTRLGRILQIPRENTFAFLKAIGGDCAGAIAFYPEGVRPSLGEPRFRRLSDDEAGAILDALPRRPLSIGEDGFRISGAGAQDIRLRRKRYDGETHEKAPRLQSRGGKQRFTPSGCRYGPTLFDVCLRRWFCTARYKSEAGF